MSDAMNQMYITLLQGQDKLEAYMSFNESRCQILNDKIDLCSDKVDKIDSLYGTLELEVSNVQKDKLDRSEFLTLQKEVAELKASNQSLLSLVANLETEQSTTFREHDQRISNNKLDIKRSTRTNNELTERVNVLDIKSNQSHLFIDGIPESKERSTAEVLIDRLQTDAQVVLAAHDFISIFRMGKPRRAKAAPRKIKVKVASDRARNDILSCRGKLKANTDGSLVWINEDHPDAYRRRKLMLRELVKHINNQKGHFASIEAGGLKLDGKLYGPDDFDNLPIGCQPHCVQIVNTEHNTTLFAGEWAFLSNMFPCSLIYDGTRFTSSEQCFQFVRARTNKELVKARKIITTNDPFVCKQLGDGLNDTKNWREICEEKMLEINRLKFEQNPSLLDLLLDTGDRILQEATTSSIWGIGAGIRSKAARENTTTGDNLMGKILMQLRSELSNTFADNNSISDNSSCNSSDQADVDLID